MTLSVKATPQSAQVGQEVTLTADVKWTGAGDAVVEWAATEGSLAPTTGEQVVWSAPGEPGSYKITAIAKANGKSITNSVTVNVIAAGGTPGDGNGNGSGNGSGGAGLECDLDEFGDGTADKPFAIFTVEELQDMNKDLTAHYALCSDIDASDTENWNDEAGFEPIGTEGDPFTGTLDGRGFEIQGLRINRPSENVIGLFGDTEGAEIRNVGLTGGEIEGYEAVGALIGRARSTRIVNSYNANEVRAVIYLGGLVGVVTGDGDFAIKNSYNAGDIVATRNGHGHGGLIGHGYAGARFELLIEDSHNIGHIKGTRDVGGLIGNVLTVTIRNSYNAGPISIGMVGGEKMGPAGGLIGAMTGGLVEGSYNTGDVLSILGAEVTKVGGLVGHQWGDARDETDAFIIDSYNTGKVRGRANVGGVVGYMHAAAVENVSNSGDIFGVKEADKEVRDIGGIAGTLNHHWIRNATNTGNVEPRGGRNVGDIVGYKQNGTVE